jgi:hypothetical protein
MDLSLFLSLIGVILGIVSSWPQIRRWFATLRGSISERARRRRERFELRFDLLMTSTGYLVSHISLNVCLAAALLLLASTLSVSPSEAPQAYVAVRIVRLLVLLVAGNFFGNAIGVAFIRMRFEERLHRKEA